MNRPLAVLGTAASDYGRPTHCRQGSKQYIADSSLQRQLAAKQCTVVASCCIKSATARLSHAAPLQSLRSVGKYWFCTFLWAWAVAKRYVEAMGLQAHSNISPLHSCLTFSFPDPLLHGTIDCYSGHHLVMNCPLLLLHRVGCCPGVEPTLSL
jgi:hypothetical protein